MLLRPSSAAIWVKCFGYAAMRAAYPDTPEEADDDIREDGTACHWLASEIWQGRTVAEGSLSPNNRIIDAEMFDAVDVYHDVLLAWTTNKCDVICERQVPTSSIHSAIADGTPDAYHVDRVQRLIRIGDLKYGFRFVEAWENWQMICYALALREMYAISVFEEEHWHVEMTIVQPRSNHRDGPVRTWRVRLSDLRAHANILIAAAEQASKPNPECTPNPGCVDCPGRHACMALQNAALSALEITYTATPFELPAAALGDELRRLRHAQTMLEARVTGLQVHAESLLRNGTYVPGWALAPTFARETWHEGMAAHVIAFAQQYFGIDIAKPAKPITPNQARKAGVPTDIVAAFAHKPSTGVKLVPQDPYEARKKFGGGL